VALIDERGRIIDDILCWSYLQNSSEKVTIHLNVLFKFSLVMKGVQGAFQMSDLSNLIQGVIFLGGTGFLIVLIVWTLIIYLIITAWFNIKHTRLNTEKIVELLSDIYNRNNDSPLDQEHQEDKETPEHGSEQTGNASSVDKSIESYNGWWVKLNPSGRQPEANVVRTEESNIGLPKVIDQPTENGNTYDVITEADEGNEEKWWNRKIF
jgi:hypothetical protein